MRMLVDKMKKVEVIDVLEVGDNYLISLKGSNNIFKCTKLISSKSTYEVRAVESQSVKVNKIIGVVLSSRPTDKVLEIQA